MMKACLTLLVFSCFHRFFLCKALPDTSARKAAFSGTVPARGLSGQQQFDRALSCFARLQAANFQEIEIGNPASGELRATGFVESRGSGAASRNSYKTNFTFVVRLLSGAYRYELRDFRTVPFKKGRYCTEREKPFDTSGFQNGNSPMQLQSRHNKSIYQQAERIAKLISSSVQQTLAKN